MSLTGFQTALADLVASPAHCLAVRRDPAAALAAYDLDAREAKRLAAVVWQRGMSANCTVYRATRLTPLYTLLPLTFAALGDAMTRELDDYWRAAPRMDVHFDIEIGRFGAHLAQRLRAGLVAFAHPGDAVADLLAIEVAQETLRLSAAGSSSAPVVLRVGYDPLDLFAAARRAPVDFGAAARRGHWVRVERADGAVRLHAAPA